MGGRVRGRAGSEGRCDEGKVQGWEGGEKKNVDARGKECNDGI